MIKPSLSKVQAETMMVTIHVGVIVIVIDTVVLEVGMDQMVESALSVASQDILLGNVQVKEEEVVSMAAEMTGMVEAVVEVAMVLIEMEIDLVGAIGMLGVVVEVLVVIDIIVTGLDLMSVGVQEAFVLDRVTFDSGMPLNDALCFSHR